MSTSDWLHPLWPGTKDDLGERVPFRRCLNWHDGRLVYAGASKQVRGHTRACLLLLIVFSPAIVFMVLRLFFDPLRQSTEATLVGVLMAAVGALAGVFILRTMVCVLWGKHGRDAMLALARCPCCGQSLRGVPSADGLTTCPECAAVWRLPDPAPSQSTTEDTESTEEGAERPSADS